MSNAQERGDVRRQLLHAQAELAEARSELSLWAQNAGSSATAVEKDEIGNNGNAKLDSRSHEQKDKDAEPPSSVATLMESLTDMSSQLAKDAVADEQAFKY